MGEEKERFTVEVKEKKDPTPKQRFFVQPAPEKPATEQPWYEDMDTLVLVAVAIVLLIIALTIIPFVPPPP